MKSDRRESSAASGQIWKLLLPVFVVVAVDSVGSGIIMPLLPFYAVHLGASALAIGFLLASFSACQLFAGPMLGALSDRYGRKRVLVVSQFGTLLSFILMARAKSLAMLFVARALDGLTSGNLSAAASFAADNSTATNRKQALGIVSAAIGAGLLIGPGLSSIFSKSPSEPIWAAAFLSALSVIGSIVLIPTQKIKVRSEQHQANLSELLRKPEIKGILTLLALFYIALGVYTAGLALVLHARVLWHGQPFGQRQLGFVFMTAGAMNLLVQLALIKPVGRMFKDWELALASFVVLTVGYVINGFNTQVFFVGAAVLLTSSGSAFLRPTLMTALTLATPRSRQGILSGFNQSLMATATIIAPILAGALINREAYHSWALSASTLTAIGAITTAVIVAMRKWPAALPEQQELAVTIPSQ